MKRFVLADTGPLYAAADPSDQHHRRAQDDIGRLAAEGLAVTVVWPIFLETYTLVRRRLGHGAAQTWLRDLATSARLLTPGDRDYAEAMRQTADHPDQTLTLFDTLLGVVSKRLALPVWSYDPHFKILRVPLWR